MRDLTHLDKFRIPYMGSMGDKRNGAFELRLNGTNLRFVVFASDGYGWDHVSVSTAERCPRWAEMQQVKELFFDSDEVVIQIHPAEENYVNNYQYCLHMWRPQKGELPLPPPVLVGFKEVGTLG